jgi:hypothetical protein
VSFRLSGEENILFACPPIGQTWSIFSLRALLIGQTQSPLGVRFRTIRKKIATDRMKVERVKWERFS